MYKTKTYFPIQVCAKKCYILSNSSLCQKVLLFDVNLALSIYFIYPWPMEAKSLAIIIWEITNRLLKTSQQNVKHCTDDSLNMVVCLHINA